MSASFSQDFALKTGITVNLNTSLYFIINLVEPRLGRNMHIYDPYIL